jgi:hypothetical protein
MTPHRSLALRLHRLLYGPQIIQLKNIALSYSVVDNCATGFSPQATASVAISKVEIINKRS